MNNICMYVYKHTHKMYISMYVLSYAQISIDEGLSVPPISYM